MHWFTASSGPIEWITFQSCCGVVGETPKKVNNLNGVGPTSRTWQFCERDLFGMVSENVTPNSKVVLVTSNVWR